MKIFVFFSLMNIYCSLTYGSPNLSKISRDQGIDIYEKVNVGNFNQQIWVHGDPNKPLLLFLHGGPGWPHLDQSMAETRLVKSHYLTVQWDQRGAGASYEKSLRPEDLTIELMISDTINMIEYLLQRFKKKKLYLTGHSWGASLGLWVVNQRPDLIYAFAANSLPVDLTRSFPKIVKRLISKAKQQKLDEEQWSVRNEQALDTLLNTDSKKIFSGWSSFLKELANPRATLGMLWLRDIKRVNLYLREKRNITPHFANKALSDQYQENLKKGNRLNQQLFFHFARKNWTESISEIKVPLIVLLGRHDYNIDPESAEAYINKLVASCKRVFWFERSAHMPAFEEPQKFQRIMNENLLKLGQNKCD